MPENLDFKFLEERPLEKSEEFSNAKFGHEEISSALCKVISKCPAPFTVGLFGRWGAGKSTIANSIREKLLPNKIAVVLFDVWKHEGDALRRTFLKESVRQLKSLGENYFNQSFQIDERLDQSVSRSSEGKFIINKGKIKQLLILGGSVLLLIIFLGCLAFYFGLWNGYWQLLRTVGGIMAGITGGVALGTWLMQSAVHFFSTETVTYGVDKLQDPHQFEAEFGRILGGLKNPRLLVIFDNLDRVTHDKSLEVLSTIKTFLEPKDIEDKKKEVVFLVPCDARAIKSHVANVYKSNEGDTPFSPDEFLRKFFNSIIWIPDFIPSELESFARASLQSTKVLDLEDDRVAWIITKAFRENPRQIVQFTNILLANYLLVKEREGKGDFPDGFAKANIAQLTKYLILSELFPDEMEALRDAKVLDLEDVKENELTTKNKKGFIKFLGETQQDIPIDNLKIFFTLRRSEQEKKLPGIESFISLLEDKKVDEAREYFDKLGDFSNPQTQDDLSQVIKTELENKTNPVSAVSLIGTLLAILSEKNIALSDTAYGEINNKLTVLCLKSLHSITPAVLDQQILASFSTYRSTIVKQWVEVLEDRVEGKGVYQVTDAFTNDVLRVFADHPEYLDTTLLNQVKKLLHEKLAANSEVTDIFIKDSKIQKIYLTPEYVRAIFSAIPLGGEPADIANGLNRLAKIETDIMKNVGGDFIVNKLSELQTAENQKATPERLPAKETIADTLVSFIDAQKATFVTTKEAPGDTFATSLIAAINAIPDYNNKKVFIPILTRVITVASVAKKAEIQTQFKNFYSNASTTSIDYVLDKIENQEELIEQQQYPALESRALGDQPFFEYLYEKLSKAKKEELLNKLFDRDFNRALQFAEKLDYKLPNQKSFAEKVLAKFDAVPSAPEKKRMLDVVITLKGANDASVRDIFAEKIQTSLTTVDSQLQDIAHASLIASEKFLSDTRKRQIVKHVFDWLKKPEVPKYQPASIKAVYALKSQFNDEEDKEFLQFIFEELIRKATSNQEVDLGFSLLVGISPKYETRKQNFDDIKTRVEAEPDGVVRQSLFKGLKTMRPESVNQKNKNYWEWVDSLS